MADEPDDNNPLKQIMGVLQNLIAKPGSTQQGSESNFFQMLISLFKLILGDDPNPQSGDGPDDQTRSSTDLRRSATDYYTKPENRTTIPDTLSQMRTGGDQRASSPSDVALRVTSGFNEVEPNVRDHVHKGVDLAPVKDADGVYRGPPPTIQASKDGVILAAGWENGFGNTVIIGTPDGHQIIYGHLASIADLHPGDRIHRNDKIGVMGSTGHSTGMHLHYEERNEHGVPIQPEIDGIQLAKGQRITPQQNQQFLASLHQNEGQPPVVAAETHPPAQSQGNSQHTTDFNALLASLGPSGTYVPPVSAGTKPVSAPQKGLG